MKTKIKIIKKSRNQEPENSGSAKPQTGRALAREMVTTVKGWVGDFQSQKKEKSFAAHKKSQLILVPQKD